MSLAEGLLPFTPGPGARKFARNGTGIGTVAVASMSTEAVESEYQGLHDILLWFGDHFGTTFEWDINKPSVEMVSISATTLWLSGGPRDATAIS